MNYCQQAIILFCFVLILLNQLYFITTYMSQRQKSSSHSKSYKQSKYSSVIEEDNQIHQENPLQKDHEQENNIQQSIPKVPQKPQKQLTAKQKLRLKLQELKLKQRQQRQARKQSLMKKMVKPKPQKQKKYFIVNTHKEQLIPSQKQQSQEDKQQKIPVVNINKQMAGVLETNIIDNYNYGENEFFDQDCVQADNNLSKSREENEDKTFKKKLKKVSGIMARLSKSVNQLKDKYNQMDIAQLLSKKPNKKKEAIALAFVTAQQQKKNDLLKKVDEIKSIQNKNKEKQEQQKAKKEQKLKQKRIKRLKKEFQKKRKQKQSQKNGQKKKQQKVHSFMSKYLNEKPLYMVLQQKFQKKVIKQKLKQKDFLNKRGELYKPFQDYQFKQHLKAHEQKLRDVLHVKEQQKIQKHHEIVQQNLHLLQKIYRGKTYERVQQEQEERQRLKLQALQKKRREKKYAVYVKQNFKPEVAEKDEDQQQNNISIAQQKQEDYDDEDQEREKPQKYPDYKKIKRYKYLQGQSCGQIVQTIKLPCSQKMQKKIGNGYLSYLYNLPKKKSQNKKSNQQLKPISAPVSKPKVQIPSFPRDEHPKVKISQNPNRFQIKNMLILLKSKDEMAQMKNKHLRFLSQRNRYSNGQSEINDNIIDNIQRKLSLLNQL